MDMWNTYVMKIKAKQNEQQLRLTQVESNCSSERMTAGLRPALCPESRLCYFAPCAVRSLRITMVWLIFQSVFHYPRAPKSVSRVPGFEMICFRGRGLISGYNGGSRDSMERFESAVTELKKESVRQLRRVRHTIALLY